MSGRLAPLELLRAALKARGLYGDVQGALPLGVTSPQVRRQLEYSVSSPGGDVTYLFPTTTRGAVRAERQRLLDNLVGPLLADTAGRLPERRKADALRLARRVLDGGLPSTKLSPPLFDVVARNPRGTATAAFQGPDTVGDPRSAFLNDLVATDRDPGAGYRLLRGALSDPNFMPAVDQLYFTPLEGARKFYKDKFGADYVAPTEAPRRADVWALLEKARAERDAPQRRLPLEEPGFEHLLGRLPQDQYVEDAALRRLLEALGETGNAEDLGVGVIRRRCGGVV